MTGDARSPIHRFSDRVEAYARYRPGYPRAVIDVLRRETGLSSASAIADIGSGTGLSAELFLRNGNHVWCVEPNPSMREVAKERLGGHPGFRSVAGAAEATTLPDASVDYVAAGQAFHWFDPGRAAAEFRRILVPGGWAVLFWNTRRTGSTPFLRAFEALLRRHGTDYRVVRHDRIPEATFERFFGGSYRRVTVDHGQTLDLEELRGRVRSMSYVPAEGEAGHDAVMDELGTIFERHQKGGRVRIAYDTELYFGRLAGD